MLFITDKNFFRKIYLKYFGLLRRKLFFIELVKLTYGIELVTSWSVHRDKHHYATENTSRCLHL